MMRLTVVSQTPAEMILKVEGWISGAEVALLEEEGTRLQEGERLVLDLSGVHSIDEDGIALLQRWSGDRLELRGGSAFVRRLLEVNGLL